MLRTEVGYAGGTTEAPTYRQIGDHAEVLQVEFDASQVQFGDFLPLFWNGHDPTRGGGSQYRAILLCESKEQFEIAQRSKAEQEAKLGRPVQTEIEFGAPYYPAEDYHQKWKLRQKRGLFAELLSSFVSERALTSSQLATDRKSVVRERVYGSV